MSNQIDISKLDKAEVLALLYNASKQQGMGFMHQRGANGMTQEEAQSELESNKSKYFDYLHGRVMKVDLSNNMLYTGLYDRDNGPGAALRALQPLLSSANAA